MSKTLASAKTLSIIGHPLILGNLYVIIMSFQKMPSKQALWVSGMTLLLVTLPIIFHNLRKTKSGAYSNFDVSDQAQRKSFYPFAIGLFVLLNLLFFLLDLPRAVIYHTLNFLVFLIIMALVNFRIKASLHAGIAFFIAVSLWEVHLILGSILLFLALGIAWSRLFTGRHSLNELIIGSMLGIISGLFGVFLII
jgi:membrane-associated phospholipid phosphatase